MDYQKKYLKYKNKYLELKQKGGNNRASIDDEKIGITCDELPKFGFGNRQGTCWLIVCMTILLFCDNRKLQTIFIENKNNTINVSDKYYKLSTFMDVKNYLFNNKISELIKNLKNRFLIKNNLKQEINSISYDFEECISIFNLFEYGFNSYELNNNKKNEFEDPFRTKSKTTEISQESSYFSLINRTGHGANNIEQFLFFNIISILLLDKYICTEKISDNYDIHPNNIGILVYTLSHSTCFLKCSEYTYYVNNEYIIKYDYIKFFDKLKELKRLNLDYTIIYINNLIYFGPCIVVDNTIETFVVLDNNSNIILPDKQCIIDKTNKIIELSVTRENIKKSTIQSFDSNVNFSNCYFTDENDWYTKSYQFLVFILKNSASKNNIIEIYKKSSVDINIFFKFIITVNYVFDYKIIAIFCKYINDNNLQLSDNCVLETLTYVLTNYTLNLLDIYLYNINVSVENINNIFNNIILLTSIKPELFTKFCQYIKDKNIQLSEDVIINILVNSSDNILIMFLNNIDVTAEHINKYFNTITINNSKNNKIKILFEYIKNKNIQLTNEVKLDILTKIILFNYDNNIFSNIQIILITNLLKIFLNNITITSENIISCLNNIITNNLTPNFKIFNELCKYINKEIKLSEEDISNILVNIFVYDHNNSVNILNIFLDNIEITTENINKHLIFISKFSSKTELFNVFCQYIKNKNIQLTNQVKVETIINIIDSSTIDMLNIFLNNIEITNENISECFSKISLSEINKHFFDILIKYKTIQITSPNIKQQKKKQKQQLIKELKKK